MRWLREAMRGNGRNEGSSWGQWRGNRGAMGAAMGGDDVNGCNGVAAGGKGRKMGGSLGQDLRGHLEPWGVTRTKPSSTLTAAPPRLLPSLALPGPIPQCHGGNLGAPRWEGRPQTRILNPRNWQLPAPHWGIETPGSCCGRTRRGTREQGGPWEGTGEYRSHKGLWGSRGP